MGIKELCIIAQDTTSYGIDLYGRLALPSFLEKAACGQISRGYACSTFLPRQNNRPASFGHPETTENTFFSIFPAAHLRYRAGNVRTDAEMVQRSEKRCKNTTRDFRARCSARPLLWASRRDR